MDLATARQLLNLKDDTVSCFLVEPASLALTDEVAAAIERAIPGVDCADHVRVSARCRPDAGEA